MNATTSKDCGAVYIQPFATPRNPQLVHIDHDVRLRRRRREAKMQIKNKVVRPRRFWEE